MHIHKYTYICMHTYAYICCLFHSLDELKKYIRVIESLAELNANVKEYLLVKTSRQKLHLE